MKYFLLSLALATTAFAQTPNEVSVANLTRGDLIPEIRATTTDGKPFHLNNDLKGKVVLIDFWATWCGPCLAETPNVLKNYERWHQKGFEVVSISLDSNPTLAINYVKNKKLPFIHICDGLAYNSPLAKAFKIRAIPQLILLDRYGRVISNEARGDKLTALLEAEMNNPSPPPSSTPQPPRPTPLAALQALVNSGPDAQASQAVEALLDSPTIPYTDIENFVCALAKQTTPPASPWATYLLTDALLSRRSNSPEVWRNATCLRARCALELGALFMAEELIHADLAPEMTTCSAYKALTIHHAAKSGQSELALTYLHSQTLRNETRYDEVKAAIQQIDQANPGKSAHLLADLKLWLKSQENLPANRMQSSVANGKITVTYNPTGTNLAGSLGPSLMVSPDNATFFSVPLIANEAGFSATFDAPEQGHSIRWYVADRFARSDTNEGKFWSYPTP